MSGGPPRMDPPAVDRFLRRPRWAACCVEDPDGRLVAAPVFVGASVADELELAVPDRRMVRVIGRGAAPAALTADEFESYEGIVGVIVRGRLGPGPRPGGARFAVERVAGFVFAGTLPRELRE